MNSITIFLMGFLLFFSGCIYLPRTNAPEAPAQVGRFEGHVKIGMTREQVRENWGAPDRIVKKKGKNYDEIWIYIPHWKIRIDLYFKDGILIEGIR